MQQFKALVKLKWLLAWRRSSQSAGNFFIGSLFVFGGIALSIVVAIVISILGTTFHGQGELGHLRMLAVVSISLFLVFSSILPAIYLGSGPTDERVFLYFPIPRGRLFGLSFLSATISVDHLLVLPGLVALLFAPMDDKASMSALVLVGILYFLFAFAFSYAFASWLSRVMKQRKSRERLMFLFVVALLVVSMVAPFLENQKNSTENLKQLFQWVSPWLEYLPMYALANLHGAAINGSIKFGPIVIMFIWILGFVFLAWIGFLFSLKEPGSESSGHASGLSWPFRWTPSWVSSPTSAVAAKELTYIFRSLTGRMNFLVLPVIVILLSGKNMSGAGQALGFDLRSYALIGLSFYTALLIVPFATNGFGFEGNGFKNYAFSPASGHVVLGGKNLGLLLYYCILILIGTALISVFQGFQFLQWFNALLFQAFLFVIFVMVGNWASIRFPALRDPASMKNASSNVGALVGLGLVLYAGLMFFLVYLIPLFLDKTWLTPLLAIALFLVHFFWYRFMLPKFGAWFEQRLPSMMEKLKSA